MDYQALADYKTMKERFARLEAQFNDEEFWEWYNSYRYASKAICERIRKEGE